MDISFRGLAFTNLENVVQWILVDGVQRWWYPEGTSEEEIRAEWEPRARGDPNEFDKTACYIININDHDIGLVVPPTDVVYSLEAGTAPPRPTFGWR